MCDCTNCRNRNLISLQISNYGTAYGERWCESAEKQRDSLKCLYEKEEKKAVK